MFSVCGLGEKENSSEFSKCYTRVVNDKPHYRVAYVHKFKHTRKQWLVLHIKRVNNNKFNSHMNRSALAEIMSPNSYTYVCVGHGTDDYTLQIALLLIFTSQLNMYLTKWSKICICVYCQNHVHMCKYILFIRVYKV